MSGQNVSIRSVERSWLGSSTKKTKKRKSKETIGEDRSFFFFCFFLFRGRWLRVRTNQKQRGRRRYKEKDCDGLQGKDCTNLIRMDGMVCPSSPHPFHTNVEKQINASIVETMVSFFLSFFFLSFLSGKNLSPFVSCFYEFKNEQRKKKEIRLSEKG